MSYAEFKTNFKSVMKEALNLVMEVDGFEGVKPIIVVDDGEHEYRLPLVALMSSNKTVRAQACRAAAKALTPIRPLFLALAEPVDFVDTQEPGIRIMLSRNGVREVEVARILAGDGGVLFVGEWEEDSTPREAYYTILMDATRDDAAPICKTCRRPLRGRAIRPIDFARELCLCGRPWNSRAAQRLRYWICRRKIPHTFEEAQHIAEAISMENLGNTSAYMCPFDSSHYHVGNSLDDLAEQSTISVLVGHNSA